MSKQSLMFWILICFSFVVFVNAQDDGQAGFISIDCGRLPKNATYSEPGTGITYVSDAAFVDGGESQSIAPEYKDELQEQVAYLRAFPEGIRNCYTINVTRNTRYSIRAVFVYGNYDGLSKTPEFDLYYGVNRWDTVVFNNMGASTVKEVVHIPVEDVVHVCLVNTGLGTPIVSALELRPLRNISYVTPSGSLALSFRADVGGSLNESSYRYPYDAFDRMWVSYNSLQWTPVKTDEEVYPGKNYQPPNIIMNTACTPKDEDSPMVFGWTDPNLRAVYYVYMYFAELVQLSANESRGFNILWNSELLYGPLYPMYLNQTTIYTPTGLTGGNFTFALFKLQNSTLPPIFNAIEVYTLVDLSQSETDQNDVRGITKIKSVYGVKKNWEADPCLPKDYLWSGVNCSYDEGLDPPRITSLNLSSSGLTGEISSYISNLTLIEVLDLSNNSLNGSVPDFLAQLPNLRVLNLERNNLTGSIPAELVKKSESGLLLLSIGENVNMTCSSLNPCGNGQEEKKKEKKSNIIIPIAAGAGGSVVLMLITVIAIFAIVKRRNARSRGENDPLASKKMQYTYADIIRITRNFEKVLGKGGFGTVYHGLIDGNTQVAVKVLAPPQADDHGSQQSQTAKEDNTQSFHHQQFQAEVLLLMRVHHGNLTSLVGYCNEGDKKALIYEYMTNGDLESHILGDNNGNVLTWDCRLQIAIDSAQGLEYLHTGCKPQIAHRDVKSTNILLNERFQAKIADFGLSKVFADENATHVLTKVAGTRGYLDPEYYSTGRLTEKSDVYSFGVVLIEIITGRPAISRDAERSHVIQWVNSVLSKGDIKSIVEPKLRGEFDTNSVWKAVELAMACAAREPANRPTMSQVVTELKECLAAELTRRNNANRVTASPIDDSVELLSVNMTSGLSPSVR